MNAKPKYDRSMLWLYVPLAVFFIYLYINVLGFNQTQNNNLFLGGMYFVEFGVHEASHFAFAFLPAVFTAAAGSLGEVAFTMLLAYACFRAKAYFAASFSLIWVALAMNSAGNYMADARAQAMPLIGAGPDPIHDWHFVFSQLGWLSADAAIGGTVRVLGDLIGLVGIIIAVSWIVQMASMTKASK